MIKYRKEQYFIVTGASSGIGQEISLLLNRLGASVIAIARDLNRLENLKNKSEYPENLYIEKKDLVEDIENLPNFIKELKNKYGKLQGFAHCAGIGEIKPLSASDYSDLHKVFDINYFVPILMLKGFTDKRVNVGRGASAVMISSAAAQVFDRGHTAYSGSKSALCASCTCIAKEVADLGIRVNCVLPSDIDTPMTQKLKDFRHDPLNKYPFGLGSVDDVANMVIFLLSDKAKWITGQNYIIDCTSF